MQKYKRYRRRRMRAWQSRQALPGTLRPLAARQAVTRRRLDDGSRVNREGTSRADPGLTRPRARARRSVAHAVSNGGVGSGHRLDLERRRVPHRGFWVANRTTRGRRRRRPAAGRRDVLGWRRVSGRLGTCRGVCTACATTTGRWSGTNGSPARRARRAGATTRRCSPPTAAPRRVWSTSRPMRPGSRSGSRCGPAAGWCAGASPAARRCGSERGHRARTRARTRPRQRGSRGGRRGFLVALTRLLGLRAGASSRLRLVALTDPALAPLPVDVAWVSTVKAPSTTGTHRWVRENLRPVGRCRRRSARGSCRPGR
jgi:hypothetical protein